MGRGSESGGQKRLGGGMWCQRGTGHSKTWSDVEFPRRVSETRTVGNATNKFLLPILDQVDVCKCSPHSQSIQNFASLDI